MALIPQSSALAFLQGRAHLGQGSWNLGQGRRPLKTEVQALRTGLKLGLSVIDTAEMYGEGLSEELIGEVLRQHSADNTGNDNTHPPFIVSKVLPHHASRRDVPRAFEASRQRLGVEKIDLYLLHWRGNTPLAETVEALEELCMAGKVGRWGVSNFDTADMQELWQVPQGRNCAVNQVLYNVRSRGIEYDLLPWCAEHGVGVMAYCPLGHRELIEDSMLLEIADKHDVSTTAVALAWVMRSGQVIAIPESGFAGHVQANAEALELQLDAQDLALIDATSPPPEYKEALDIL